MLSKSAALNRNFHLHPRRKKNCNKLGRRRFRCSGFVKGSATHRCRSPACQTAGLVVFTQWRHRASTRVHRGDHLAPSWLLTYGQKNWEFFVLPSPRAGTSRSLSGERRRHVGLGRARAFAGDTGCHNHRFAFGRPTSAFCRLLSVCPVTVAPTPAYLASGRHFLLPSESGSREPASTK